MRKSKFDYNGVELPDAGGLSGVKRMQMQQRGTVDSTGRTQRTGGVMPPTPTGPAGYENQSAVQKLMGVSNPSRRRGKGY
jgi:hypothetical protein